MPLSTIFQLYHDGQFYWWRKSKYPVKTNDMPKFVHIMSNKCNSPRVGIKLTTLVVICTDCIGSCKSNYHTITTMTALSPSMLNLFHWS